MRLSGNANPLASAFRLPRYVPQAQGSKKKASLGNDWRQKEKKDAPGPGWAE